MRVIFLIGCLFLVARVQAQYQKGTKYLGGTISLNGTKSKPEADAGIQSIQSYLSLNPSVQAGLFIKEKAMIGLGFGTDLDFYWNKSKPSKSLPLYKSHTQIYTLSPFVRHYKSLNAKWAIFLNSSAEISLLKSKTITDDYTVKSDGYGIGLKIVPGVSYWLTPRFALESDINLLSLGAGYRNFYDSDTFYFNSAVTSNLSSYFSIRASWYLSKP